MYPLKTDPQKYSIGTQNITISDHIKFALKYSPYTQIQNTFF